MCRGGGVTDVFVADARELGDEEGCGPFGRSPRGWGSESFIDRIIDFGRVPPGSALTGTVLSGYWHPLPTYRYLLGSDICWWTRVRLCHLLVSCLTSPDLT